MTPVTGKMGRMSAPDIHEERLKTLRRRALERLRRRHSYRCPDCGYGCGRPWSSAFTVADEGRCPDFGCYGKAVLWSLTR